MTCRPNLIFFSLIMSRTAAKALPDGEGLAGARWVEENPLVAGHEADGVSDMAVRLAVSLTDIGRLDVHVAVVEIEAVRFLYLPEVVAQAVFVEGLDGDADGL